MNFFLFFESFQKLLEISNGLFRRIIGAKVQRKISTFVAEQPFRRPHSQANPNQSAHTSFQYQTTSTCGFLNQRRMLLKKKFNY